MKKKDSLIYIPEINGIPVILNTDLFPFYEFLITKTEQFPYYSCGDSISADIFDVRTRLLKEKNCGPHLQEMEELEIVPIKDTKQFCDNWDIVLLLEKGM